MLRYWFWQAWVWVRGFQHLVFVPIDDVPSAFISLCDEIHSERCLDDFLAYFSSKWKQGFAAGRSARFPPACWNLLDRTLCHLNRSNQTTTLKLGTSSSLYKLDTSSTSTQQYGIFWQQCTMYMEQSSTDEKFLLEGNGDQPPGERNDMWRETEKSPIWSKLMIGIDWYLTQISSEILWSQISIFCIQFECNLLFWNVCISLVTLVTPKFNNWYLPIININ